MNQKVAINDKKELTMRPARVINRGLVAKRITEMWGGSRKKNLAHLLGISVTAVNNYESQKSAPHADILDGLRLLLGFDTIDDMFYHRSGDTSQTN